MPAGLKSTIASPDDTCTGCKKSQAELGVPLKICAGCKTALYCSKKCQEAERKGHGSDCQAIRAGASSLSGPTPPPVPAAPPLSSINLTADRPSRPLDARDTPLPEGKRQIWIASNMAKLQRDGQELIIEDILRKRRQKKWYDAQALACRVRAWSEPQIYLLAGYFRRETYLSVLPRAEVIRQLIDCFRLRISDEYVFNAQLIGVYGQEDPTPFFVDFMDKVERSGTLPEWWTVENRREAELLSQDETGGNCIRYRVGPGGLISNHGGDVVMALKLRGLAAKVYGPGVHAD